jgi:hypothetical protein
LQFLVLGLRYVFFEEDSLPGVRLTSTGWRRTLIVHGLHVIGSFPANYHFFRNMRRLRNYWLLHRFGDFNGLVCDEGEAEGAATAGLIRSYGLGLHEPTAHSYHRSSEVVKPSPNLKISEAAVRSRHLPGRQG